MAAVVGYGVLALAAVLLLVAGASTAARLVLAARARRRSREVARLRPAVAAIVAAAEDDDADAGSGPGGAGASGGAAGERLAELAAGLRAGQRRALTEVVLGYLGKLRGPARRPLLALLARDGTVPAASRELRRRDWVRRARGADMLGRAGQPSVATDLAALLADPVAEVRAVAAAGLPAVLDGQRATGWVVTELLRTAGRDRQLPAGLVVESLLRLGPDAVPPLLAALGTQPGEVREIAAEALGRLGADEAATALAEAVHDPEAGTGVRARAATALGRLGMPALVDPLAAALEADHPLPVRTAAALALADLGDPAAVPALVGLLDQGHPLAGTAAAALGRLGAPGLLALDAVRRARPGSPAGRHAAAELAAQEVRGQPCPEPPPEPRPGQPGQPAPPGPAARPGRPGAGRPGQLTGAGG